MISLEAEGFEVRSAARGDEAIATGSVFRPHYLITDWMLRTGRDGVDVARFLLLLFPQMRIIFLTGMTVELMRQRTAGLPYEAILIKPVDIEDVLTILRGHRRETAWYAAHPA